MIGAKRDRFSGNGREEEAFYHVAEKNSKISSSKFLRIRTSSSDNKTLDKQI